MGSSTGQQLLRAQKVNFQACCPGFAPRSPPGAPGHLGCDSMDSAITWHQLKSQLCRLAIVWFWVSNKASIFPSVKWDHRTRHGRWVLHPHGNHSLPSGLVPVWASVKDNQEARGALEVSLGLTSPLESPSRGAYFPGGRVGQSCLQLVSDQICLCSLLLSSSLLPFSPGSLFCSVAQGSWSKVWCAPTLRPWAWTPFWLISSILRTTSLCFHRIRYPRSTSSFPILSPYPVAGWINCGVLRYLCQGHTDASDNMGPNTEPGFLQFLF